MNSEGDKINKSLHNNTNDVQNSENSNKLQNVNSSIKTETSCHCDIKIRLCFILCSIILLTFPLAALIMIKVVSFNDVITNFLGNIFFSISYVIAMFSIVVIILASIRRKKRTNHVESMTDIIESKNHDEGSILIYSFIAILGFGDSVFNLNRLLLFII